MNTQKPRLKFTNKKVIEVDDWDFLVQNTYGRTYSFQQQDGCKDRGVFTLSVSKDEVEDPYQNDSVPEVINGSEMGVSFKAWLERKPRKWNGSPDDKRFLDLFWERNFYPDIQVVANDLCRRGLIEAGEYSINIDW